jgi:uncharacterized integral membrane protein
MWFLRNLAWLLTLVAVGVFIYANYAERVTAVNLIWHRWPNVPSFVALFLAFIAGMLVAFVLTFVHYLKGQAASRRLNQQVKDLKEELSTLRNLPFEDLTLGGKGQGEV